MDELNVGETITSPDNPRVLPMMEVDPPTVTMAFMTNTSPTVGQEGVFITSAKLKERLDKERKSNVSLKIVSVSLSKPNTMPACTAMPYE